MSVEKILDIRAEILNSYTSGTKDVTQIDELLTKYREAVEELSKLHQPTVISWVAVDDKMPESGQCVLIYSKNGGVAEGAWLSAKGHFEQWRWNCVQKGVTHWAELPDPPCL